MHDFVALDEPSTREPMRRLRRTSAASPLRRLGPLGVAALLLVGLPVAACSQTAPLARGSTGGAPLLDSARAELAAGRAWHAARLLGGGAPLAPEGRLLLARGEAGWGNWKGVGRALADADWLDRVEGGEGWRLLGRSLEDAERWGEAAAAYGRWLDAPAGDADSLAAAVRARRARALWHAGEEGRALEGLNRIAAEAPSLASWEAASLAAAPADAGRPQPVRTLLARVTDSTAAAGAWSLLPRALLAARDSAAALVAYRDAARLLTGARLAEALDRVGALALAARDSAAAGSASLDALAAGPRSAAGARAAARLLGIGGLDAATSATAADALRRGSDEAAAVRAYDLHVRLTGGVEGVAPEVRLDRARLLATVSGREGDAVAELEALSTHADPRVGAVALDQWARLRRRQGRGGDEATLRTRLLERYPTSAEAADVVFFRGDAAHDRNDFDTALRHYRELVAMAPEQGRAGLAGMRAGQIHLLRGRHRDALEVFEGYLRDFPRGRRWDEAAYWAAHTRLLLGDTARAREHVARIRSEDPFSYYAVLGADLLGEPFALALPAGEEPALSPWLREGLRRVDLLDAAGLGPGALAEVDGLVARSRGDQGAMLRLAEELVARGHTIPGINLVWDLRRENVPWTLRLARAAYPFPFREAVMREAREWGADPWWVVAIIRQESAFDPDIRSAAGAMGLMQVMPETGRTVARAVGPAGFTPGALNEPDVNLHLGTSYFVENLERYGGVIPLVLSAYNAGPQRADAWRGFPEAEDWLRFVERIPFGETRDYVRQVTRNRALYRVLWGDAGLRGVSD